MNKGIQWALIQQKIRHDVMKVLPRKEVGSFKMRHLYHQQRHDHTRFIQTHYSREVHDKAKLIQRT